MSREHLLCALSIASLSTWIGCVDGTIGDPSESPDDPGALIDDSSDEPDDEEVRGAGVEDGAAGPTAGDPDGDGPALAATTRCLNADGPGGTDTYDLIESVLGNNSIESPDDDHQPSQRHIREATDDVVGAHFVFVAHRDIDRDGDRTDRSRMEIKVAPSSGSHDVLKAKENKSFTYTWRFKINADMKFSNRFTHMFQLKSYQGDAGAPLITITGRKSGSGSRLEVIHSGSPSLGKLASTNLSPLKGTWLSVVVHAKFSHHGTLSVSIRKPDGTEVIAVQKGDIDLWRDGNHIRPKWGIYRGLSDQLRPQEDDVRFANFGITPGTAPTSDCHN